ncbi:hypothetical protein Nepgr_002651 [Nepenthes gracilis]|uniref:Uncharacterized protein n=1 Tax=Nepenthes gracilis TaxID=150966 RepID=A0AAD3RX31_NEPGR|nr:hypothetical protein Nepgr_002651 [Nepenthes gracilis]
MVVMDRPESHDACNSSLALASPGPPHHDTSDEVLVTNRDTITSQPPQICRADTVAQCVLEELGTCANADTSLGLPSGIPNSCEEMTIKSASLGSLSPSSILHSDDPDGGPPGRSTRARKAKRSTQVGTATGDNKKAKKPTAAAFHLNRPEIAHFQHQPPNSGQQGRVSTSFIIAYGIFRPLGAFSATPCCHFQQSKRKESS